uniref:Uncharacterized protein n=1 Tax=Anopheles darlingi TaxID=43151 RepID=A0A2M4D3V6_ANODA
MYISVLAFLVFASFAHIIFGGIVFTRTIVPLCSLSDNSLFVCSVVRSFFCLLVFMFAGAHQSATTLLALVFFFF